MAGRASFLLCLFALLASAWSARVASEQRQEWPWRKAVVVGTLLGSTLSGTPVAASPKSVFGTADLDASSDEELYGSVGRAFAKFLEPYELSDGTVVDKLMKSLSNSRGERDAEIIKDIAASLQGGPERHPEVANVNDRDSGQTAIQQIFFKDRKGERGIIVGRYLKHYRTVQAETAVLDMVRSMELSTSLDVGVFLRCVAYSHTADELARDKGAEFMVMLEPFAGALNEFLELNVIDYFQRFGIFLDTFAAVEKLYHLDIPHKSDINPQTVLVKRVPDDPKALTIVLNPAILEGREWVGSKKDRFKADVKELGKLLDWLFNQDWPAEVRQRNDIVIAFGKFLSSGGLLSSAEAGEELKTVMMWVFAENPKSEDLRAARMRYLTLAMSAAKSGERKEVYRGAFA